MPNQKNEDEIERRHRNEVAKHRELADGRQKEVAALRSAIESCLEKLALAPYPEYDARRIAGEVYETLGKALREGIAYEWHPSCPECGMPMVWACACNRQ
jgi:hypothetical protein